VHAFAELCRFLLQLLLSRSVYVDLKAFEQADLELPAAQERVSNSAGGVEGLW
jgi:hypothetical protein